jgi:hypothetical protein
MTDKVLEQVWINFSQRSVKILDNEGNDKVVTWDEEGSEGFSETVSMIQDIVDPEIVTYCFAQA